MGWTLSHLIELYTLFIAGESEGWPLKVPFNPNDSMIGPLLSGQAMQAAVRPDGTGGRDAGRLTSATTANASRTLHIAN